MEKIEADIFNIIHNTKIRLQGDAEDNYGFMGKGYAEKLAIEIAKEIQPSEKKALSRKEVYEWGYADGKKAQREVRYPIEYESDNDQGTLGDYEIGYNDAIDEMRKLNGG